jgi:hypothetical protein
MRMTADDSKLFLIRFDGKSVPSDRIPVENADDMRRIIDRAIALKETVTIVDEENTLIFRAERGIVCWPRVGITGVAA